MTELLQTRQKNGNFCSIDIVLRLKLYSKPNKNGCLEWQKYKNKNGYGVISDNGKNKLVHRVAYELKHGSIKNNLVIDHLCRNRSCINPDHLELVTQKENIIRGEQPKILSEKYRNQQKCVRGHSLLNNRYEYTRIDRTNGKTYLQRRCKTCNAENNLRKKNVRAVQHEV